MNRLISILMLVIILSMGQAFAIDRVKTSDKDPSRGRAERTYTPDKESMDRRNDANASPRD